MKLGDYVINRLAEMGADKMFVVYGAANGDLIDAFTRNKKTDYVAVMHEQAGGFAAESYAKVKKSTRCCYCYKWAWRNESSYTNGKLFL